MIIDGYIQFPGFVDPIEPRIIYVRVLDVSRADAPSRTIAEKKIEGVRLVQNPVGHRLPYRIDCQPASDSRVSMILQVHVSQHGNREIQNGDYLTTTSYPIDPQGTHQQINISVSLIS